MQASPQLRFLARASLLAIAILAVWWWFLLDPMLAILRAPTEFTLRLMLVRGREIRIVAEPGGQWSVLRPPAAPNAALQNAMDRAMRGLAGAVPTAQWHIRSESVVCSRATLSLFSLALPFYWSILLAAPPGKKRIRAALAGSALVAITAFLSLILFMIKSMNDYSQFVSGSAARFALNLGSYMGENVLPYGTPLLVAIWLHEGFRERILSSAAIVNSPVRPQRLSAACAGPPSAKKRKGRWAHGTKVR